MRALGPRERRLLAILLLIAAVVLAWFAIVGPIAGGFAERAERRRELIATYTRDERALGQAASIGRAAAAQRRRAGLFRMTAPDAASAAAMLAERLTDEVTRGGGEMRGVEDLPAPPGMVHARLAAGMTFAQAIALVARLQNGSPLLLVDATDLSVHDAADDPRAPPLDVRLAVSAAFSSTATR